MYLKSIEVQGFKSFANRIKFDFHEGITGIVGPNGSGKSNVADAVRWVFGEQRAKQLRGGSMQDVIFSGTENKRPLSYAYVSITLDNSDNILPVDYKEVTVTRKLYRSGESEYLLNGVSCRLKTINELFYDTGIGKEGYSIIGQGQIDKVLSGKPEERRELFDEAAGIVKFKRRKNQSLKKLESERLNLARVKDIKGELEKQIGPLESQSQIAKEYLKKKEDLKIYDINMFLLETSRLKDLVKELEENIENVSKEIQETDRKNKKMQEDYEVVENEMELNELSIDKTKNQHSETKLLKNQLEGQIQVLIEQIKTAKLNDQHYNKRQDVIQSEKQERELQKKELEKELEAITENLSVNNKQESLLKEELVQIQTGIAQSTEIINNNKNEIYDILKNRATTKASLQHYDTTNQQLESKRVELSDKINQIKAESKENKKVIGSLEKDLADLNQEIEGYAKEVSVNEALIKTLEGEIAQKQEELKEKERLFHREVSRLESLKNLTERYEGYGNSIKKIMTNPGRNQGLLGVVADIIKVEKVYEIAIETALGGSIQNIVTDNEESAKKTINYLKENKLGRATFLPLTSMKNPSSFSNQQALLEKGVVGVADLLVNVEEKYLGLAKQLLGRTLVVDNIDNGIKISRKYHQSLRIVTLEGELLNPGGSITGGTFKNSSNLLSRRREIEELEKNANSLKGQVANIEDEFNQIKSARASSFQMIDKLNLQISQVSVRKNTAAITLEQALKSLKEAEELYNRLMEEDNQTKQSITDLFDNAQSLQLELETSEAIEHDLNNQIQDNESSLVDERKAEGNRLKKLEDIHFEYAGLEQVNIHVKENITRIEEELNKFEEELSELAASKGGSNKEVDEKELEIENLTKAIADAESLVIEIQEEIEKHTKLKEVLTSKNKSYLDDREALFKLQSELDSESYRLLSRKKSHEENIDKYISYMWEEYEITYNRGLELRDENLTDISFMKKQIQGLKRDIKELGDVNVNAIEEYKAVSERYEFLKEQHDDLVEAEATLLEIIEELDQGMRKQFTSQFQLISSEFDKVFKALFGGGIGTLQLMEDEDILEAGINIIAQPPGKKLRTMMQLSGGEKALTAIALLFAIQNLKPSPFCLLDEIEAALDDNNVIRFAKYLDKLKKNTQFIMITHKRGTMTASDRLYGITMQEKGVSTLVSVDLVEKELS
jgi:chromosome segregation protein